MASVTSELVVIGLLVLLNGLLAMAEMAIVSSRPARLQEMVRRGVRGAKLTLRVVKEPAGFLATVQVGITLVGVVAGAYAGVTLGKELGTALDQFPTLAPYSEFLGVGIVVVATTYLSIVFGELVPKRVALTFRERLSLLVAPPMFLLQRIAAPVVWLLTVSSSLVLKLLGLQRAAGPSVTEAELLQMVRDGAGEGVFEAAERDLIEGVMELDVRTLGAVMTPRRDIVWLDTTSEPDEMIQTVVATGYTRYPVCDGSPDAVQGVVRAKGILAEACRGGPVDLEELVRPVVFVPETASALDALEALRKAEVHMVLAVDEYGTVQGLCSLADILATLVGAPIGESRRSRPSIVQRADGSYLVDGLLPVHELREHVAALADWEVDVPYHTVAGLTMSELDAIPEAGDTFIWRGLCFEIMDMDGNRVDKLLVTPCPDGDEPS